jgi:hypothetical protein
MFRTYFIFEGWKKASTRLANVSLSLTHVWGRLHLKCDGTRAENRFRLSAKRMSPFKSAGAAVHSTTGSRGVRISGSNAGYTMFRGSVKTTIQKCMFFCSKNYGLNNLVRSICYWTYLTFRIRGLLEISIVYFSHSYHCKTLETFQNKVHLCKIHEVPSRANAVNEIDLCVRGSPRY